MDYKKEVEELVSWADDAKKDFDIFAHFVAKTEFVYKNMPFPSKQLEDHYQEIWMDMEIVNAVMLCEWEKQGSPKKWHGWDKYKQDVIDVINQYIAFMTNHFLK